MGIRVLTPATDRRLTSVAKVKTRLSIPVEDSSSDGLLAELVSSVSSRFARVLGRELVRQRYALTVAAYGTRQLILPIRPIEALNAISIALQGVAVTGVTVADGELGILAGTEPFAWTAELAGVLDLSPVAGTERELYEVECWGGYLLPGQGLRRADGSGATHLEAATLASIGATQLTLTATDVTGSASKGWGLAIEGDEAVHVLAAAANVASSQLVVTLTAPLAAAVAAGTLVQFSPLYLPEAVEDLAIAAVVDRFQRKALAAGVTAIRTPGFSADFSPTATSGLPASIEADLRGLGI